MRHAMTTALDDLEEGARVAHAAENDFRAHAAREIARLERERVFAYRRVRLVRLLGDAALRAETAAADASLPKPSDATIFAAQRNAVAAEFGWDADGPRHKAVLDKLAHVGSAVAGGSGGRTALSDFEHWYQAETGAPFYALFDVYVPETPVVDF